MAYTKQVWHGKTKVWVTRLGSFKWTSPAMLVIASGHCTRLWFIYSGGNNEIVETTNTYRGLHRFMTHVVQKQIFVIVTENINSWIMFVCSSILWRIFVKKGPTKPNLFFFISIFACMAQLQLCFRHSQEAAFLINDITFLTDSLAISSFPNDAENKDQALTFNTLHSPDGSFDSRWN